jgi:RND family efflux transporter MFP subunit
MKKYMVILVPLALVLLAGVIVVRKKLEIASLPRPMPTTPTLQTAPVIDGTLEVTAHYMGQVEPYTSADLSARISGSIIAIARREGDPVRAGEVVALIDDRELSARSRAAGAEVLAMRQRQAGAQSAFETQKAIFDRDEKLYATGAISREALDRSRAAFDGAKATLDAYEESIKGLTEGSEAARTQAGYARILAPFTGVVTRRWAEPGDMAVPGKPILSIEKLSPYKVVIQVPQEAMSSLREGGAARLSDGIKTLATKVSRVYPALGANLLGSVEIVTGPSPFGLPSGSTVAVDLVTKTCSGAIVPSNALVKSAQGSFVWVVKDGIAHLRRVTELGSNDGKSAVEGPLAPGDQVAIGQENRLLGLRDGDHLRVAGASK